jgi:type VI secretion system secreted protein VgrG
MSDLITQQSREAAINTPLGEDALLIQSMSGSEQMGRLFSYNVSLLSEKEEIKIDDIIGQNVTIRLEVSEDVTRYFNGCVSRFVELPTADNKSHYQATIVPWMWFLTKSADCRIRKYLMTAAFRILN